MVALLVLKEIHLLSPPMPTMPDAVSAATKDDPRADYQTLSAQGLFFDHYRRCWVAASRETAHAVFHAPELMVRPQSEPVPATLAGTAAADIFAKLVRMNDGPVHLALKAAVQTALDSITDQDVRQATKELAHWFALPLPLDGASVTRFNYGLPILVLAKLFGIDGSYWSGLVDDVLAFTRCVAPGGTGEEMSAGMIAAERLTHCTQQQWQMPGPLLQNLLQAMGTLDKSDGSQPWAEANAIGLWFQACEGTAGLMGQGLLAGLQRGWQGNAAEWVEHVLNDLPPIQNTRRFVATDINLSGCPLHSGDEVLLLLAGHASSSEQNLAFGGGVHACPGARWARAIAITGIEHLLQQGVNAQTLLNRSWRRSPNARVPEFR